MRSEWICRFIALLALELLSVWSVPSGWGAPAPGDPACAIRFEDLLAKSPDAATLDRRVFAVHATDFFPEDGVLKAGGARVTDSGRVRGNEPPSFRPTIHWSLGELVRSHSASWEKMPFAVVVPLGGLKKQLVNLNTYDSFVLGDFKLPEGAILIAPKDFKGKVPPGVHVETYAQGTSLREAVDRVIVGQGGWPIRMAEGRDPGFDAIATLEGANIERRSVNSIAFFDSFLKANPRIAFGDHIRSQVGTGGRFGLLDQSMQNLMRQYRGGSVLSTQRTSFYKTMVEHHLRVLERERKAGKFPREGLRSLDEKIAQLREWLGIVDLDLELRKGGRTISGLGPSESARIDELRGDRERLRTYVLKELTPGSLSAREQSAGFSPDEISDFLSGMPLSEAREALSSLSASLGVEGSGELRETLTRYALKRVVVLDQAGEEAGTLLRYLDEQLSKQASGNNLILSAGQLVEILSPYLNQGSSRLESALRVLDRPSVRSLLHTHWMVRFPEEKLTLDGLIRLHPSTRILAEPPRPGALPVSPILERLELVPASPGESKLKSLGSFEAARREASYLKSQRDKLPQMMADLKRPMSQTRDPYSTFKFTLYERIKRGDFGTLEEFWKRLGIEPEVFRAAFPLSPGDRSFWESKESLESIYSRLRNAS